MGYQEPLFLIDGAQTLSVMADKLTEFIAAANTSLHIAIYDFRLHDPDVAKQIVGALESRAKAGVEVQIAYDHRNAPKFGVEDDPAPHGTHEFVTDKFTGTEVNFKPVGWIDDDVATESIAGSKLMHSKYVIRDSHTDGGAVLMGSTNFTDDAWTRQDNNVLILESPQLCVYYETDFNELWASANIYNTGVNDFGTISRDGINADIAFSPGEGRRIDTEIAQMILNANVSIHIASMVITSDTILNALSQVIEVGRVPVRGIFDGPEMKTSEEAMMKSARSATKVQQIEQLRQVLVEKRSNPYKADGVHNFMHNKLLVADDVVLTGSHNFSLSAEHNAENAILIRDAKLAEKYRDYVERLIKKYSG
jgi:phosphatidylserine/phosphatidylglycerophosphate/cardiolipin synthase-like enzyme